MLGGKQDFYLDFKYMWKPSEVKGLQFVTEETVRVCVSPLPHTHTV